ncbi:tRNA (5-methylaminomethyl-2-thiouridine)(34)-methyltransferase MnmD [Salinimicrobium sp. GXAS 041]|uniref:tRNA (5-methylaminomethyl-2-thiouridine)(34)-methyltransferase MnmD n=1 Tax=Salinimicrobium sp. GXAS 041 TaxID=3400806 RepID=UPI003C7431EB
MKREIITTADGSSTIFLPEWNEHYHSKHGAVQEAYHVFIKTGLEHFLEVSKMAKEVSILEIGYGTGLNALITFLEARKRNLQVDYTGVEAYPVSQEEQEKLNYTSLFPEPDTKEILQQLFLAPWGEKVPVSNTFSLQKKKIYFSEIEDREEYNLIFFDAFGPRVQPDLWTEEVFKSMFLALKNGGVLVTYSAKGSVRRAMETAGFTVERMPGPPGKREMLRALKK